MKLLAPAAAALALALALAGCANPDNAEQPAAAPSASGSAFPATVATKFGDVTVDAAPTRVLALGWGDAETALALGVQPVGASDWLQFGGEGVGPWASGRYDTAPEIIGTLEPSYEAIAALDPDLILDTKSSGDQKRYDRLSAIAPTVGVPEGGDSYLTTGEQQLTMVATALGRTAEATALQEGLDRAFADARTAHPDWAGKTVTAATKTSEGWGAYIEGSERVQFLQDLGFVQNPQIAALDTSATGFTVSISTEQLDLVDADLVVAFPIFIDSSELTGDRFFERVPAVADGRSLVIDGDLASAYSLGTVLAQQYALENLVPRIDETLRR
ncbi:iron complex transport system substrate-binding protein [Friedmanniella luteola]|uniref:Iron complex transport system substrate-binding protein n=1 Tax=Friedmanniella luteola TaxID=546871 RepID=A0A1H1ZFW6_9ACTN|nr:iron-siderophore ABC transporter substrate-binding protein [Friedmanniella luteola]SDT32604.1 iron complex transport system substrate-binding protein [Friedmanniella luteola]